jgi:hypothetical protein
MSNYESLALEVGSCTFELRVFTDPSGLRGQVMDGEDKVAGIQIFHSTDKDALIAKARADKAVRRRAGMVPPIAGKSLPA